MLRMWLKIGRRRYIVKMQMYAKIGVSRSSRLFVVHNRSFRDRCTHERVMCIINKNSRILITNIPTRIIAYTLFRGQGVNILTYGAYLCWLLTLATIVTAECQDICFHCCWCLGDIFESWTLATINSWVWLLATINSYVWLLATINS